MATYNVTQGVDSGAGSLREAVELANNSPGVDDIFVQTDVELNSAIEITDSVNIGTPYGSTITQTGEDRIFYIQDNDSNTQSDVDLFRLNLAGGSASMGGAIASYENLNLTDSSVYDNSAQETGAALYVEGADLNLERVNLYNNEITSETEIDDPDVFVAGGQLEFNDLVFDEIEVINETQLSSELAVETDEQVSASTEEMLLDDSELSSDEVPTEEPNNISAELNELQDSSSGDDVSMEVVADNTLTGGAEADTLIGSESNDLIRGAGGNDIIHGYGGDDYLFGSTGDDIIHGDTGNDTLNGNEGENFLLGGDGSDLFVLTTEGNNIVADFEPGIDRLQLSQISYEDLEITGDFNSYLNHRGTQIGMVMGISPAELSAANFSEA